MTQEGKAAQEQAATESGAQRGTLCSTAIFRYSLLFAWMAIIFMFSDHPNSAAATREIFGGWNFLARKLAHFTEYAILSILALNSFESHVHTKIGLKRAFYCAVILSILYACSDELHQWFVPGRSAAVTDVLVDAAGALTGAVLCYRRLEKRY